MTPVCFLPLCSCFAVVSELLPLSLLFNIMFLLLIRFLCHFTSGCVMLSSRYTVKQAAQRIDNGNGYWWLPLLIITDHVDSLLQLYPTHSNSSVKLSFMLARPALVHEGHLFEQTGKCSSHKSTVYVQILNQRYISRRCYGSSGLFKMKNTTSCLCLCAGGCVYSEPGE